MTSSQTRLPREHKRTPVDLDVIVNGVLNHIHGRITDLSEAGARIDGAGLPERSRCEIHFGGQIVYAIVMWSEQDRMGVHFPYELTNGPLFRALEYAREMAASGPAQIFLHQRSSGFGRRGLS